MVLVTAVLKLSSKKVYVDGFVVEMKIWEIKNNKNFPNKIKYSLIGIYPETGRKILMDNHHPKGHHFHVNDDEFSYQFQNLDRLIEDFKNLVQVHLGVKL